MRKNGFTLVELLAVIIIITLISLLAFPTILNKISETKNKTNKYIENIIISSAKSYVKDNDSQYIEKNGYSYCVKVKNLISGGYIDKDIVKAAENDYSLRYVSLNYDTKFNYNLVNQCYYKDFTLNGADPQLANLTPVVYENNNWVVVDSADKWYDYKNQQWANAVSLRSGVTKKAGDIVTVEGNNPEALAMFVWIPRYEYKIEGTYGTHADGTLGTAELPGEIKVNFINNQTIEATDGYILHPAFTFGTKTLNGMWVGKFETSHTTLSSSEIYNNLGCTEVNCESADGLRVLPNLTALRNNNLSNFFFASRSMGRSGNPFGFTSSVDTHMMKNSEWGAVAYLSQSIYGKYGNSMYTGANKEIYDGLTGDLYSQFSSAKICDYNDNIDRGGGIGECGGGASTTGNITGIYDMVNKAQLVMGVYGTLPFVEDIKYYDSYGSSKLTACDGSICLGHSLSETDGWYNSYSSFFNTSKGYTKLIRSSSGGDYFGDFGIFTYYGVNDNYDFAGFRVVITLN